MDLLKKEMERKRKAIELARLRPGSTASNSTPSQKYRRAGDIRRLQEEQEEREQNERKKLKYSNLKKIKDERRNNENRQEQTEEQAALDLTRSLATSAEAVSKTTTMKESPKNEETNVNNNSSSLSKNKNSASSSESPPSMAFTELSSLTPLEITNRLRQMGLPVRLFGECTVSLSDGKKYRDEQRIRRIVQAMQQEKDALVGRSEMDEFRLEKGHGIRNPFLGGRQNEDDDNNSSRDINDTKNRSQKQQQRRGGEKSKESGSANKKDSCVSAKDGEKKVNKNKEDESDPHKQIYRFFKDLIRQWEDDLAMRPEQVKRSVTGRNETKTVKQCKDYIRPLFKQCKSRLLEPGIMSKLLQIIEFAKEGEFVKAHDCYMDVAIGRAAWPIGVTMVGIHARSGRAKIESSNVAHVMNSELQRKYLTSVKRLLTYCQKKRQDVAPSKKVIN